LLIKEDPSSKEQESLPPFNDQTRERWNRLEADKNGFVGTVALTATITSRPTGAQDSPILGFGSTSPVYLTGINPAIATLTFTTEYSSSAEHIPPRPGARWYTVGGAVLACLLFFLAPR
jgi:hypothetical protein